MKEINTEVSQDQLGTCFTRDMSKEEIMVIVRATKVVLTSEESPMCNSTETI